MAQDVAELALERRERRHQRSGLELPGPADAVGEIIGWIIRKMSQICFSIQHWSAPSQALAVLLHRSAVVKVGLRVSGAAGAAEPVWPWRHGFGGMDLMWSVAGA